MVDEREERYEGEEGEYHFSDEQVNYEEVETPKARQAPVIEKESILNKLSKLSSRRRVAIAAIVFVILISVVYKILSPSSPSKMEIVPATTAEKTVAMPGTTPPPVAKPATPPTTTVSAQPANLLPPVSVPPQQGVPSGEIMPGQMTAVTPPTQPVQQPLQQSMPTMQPTAPISANNTLSKPAMDRVVAVEQQNAAIMNLLQNEYAQKMSDYEMQNNLMRGKMDEMAKRLNRMEASINQMTQLLQQGAGSGVSGRSQNMGMGGMVEQPMVPTKMIEPKMTFTVQAIIPGRAWLKSESGDTVTVAEGDLLKNYGRITKIDPYDGIVEIDTGNKIITLSYGMSVE